MTPSTVDMPFTMSPKNVREKITEFFFAEEVPYGMAVLRILAPLSLAGNLIRRWPWVRDLYSSDGAPTPLADNFGYFEFLPVIPGTVAVALFTLMMLFLLSASIGLFTRLSLVVGGALYWYFGMMDSVSTITKYSVILTHIFLLLALSQCGSVWSVDAWLARRRAARSPAGTEPLRTRFPIWPARLVQIFIGVVYIGAAITKMHTPIFFSGDQLMYWMMTHMMSHAILGDLLSQYPLVLSAFAYITIVWEVAFLFCVWFAMLRLPMLGIGAVFHAMTAISLGLLVFPMVMISSYFSFLTEEDVRWFRVRLRSFTAKLEARWRSVESFVANLAGRVPGAYLLSRPGVVAGVYAAVMAVIVMTAVEIEYRRDLYGQRRPEGRHVLQAMDPAVAEKMLGPDQPLREKDKLMALDLGTVMAGDHLIDRRRHFQHGDRVIVQASLNPPREDLWVDCMLVDGEGRLVTKIGQIAPRELFRTHFTLFMNDGLEPGPYAVVLKCDGQEVSRRRFKLTGKSPTTVTAN